MLTIFSRPDKSRGSCDGVSRRGFLKIGGMAMGGLSLAQLLSADSKAGAGSSHKAVINIYLPGGPPHQDMWDLKRDAPVEIRGEFQPIKTSVQGIEICEHFPRVARSMENFTAIRTMVGCKGGHNGFQCMTGRDPKGRAPIGGWPSFGSAASKLLGSADVSAPAYTSLCYQTPHPPWGYDGEGGFLGATHDPFRVVGGQSTRNARLGEGGGSSTGDVLQNMVLRGITLERLQDRDKLRGAFDQFRRRWDSSGTTDGLDAYTRQALDILSSSRLAKALDLSSEDPKTIERYGDNDTIFQVGGAPKMTRNFLIARRLIEAGVRVVSMNFSRWDWHGAPYGNFKRGREDMPLLDQALTALVEDLQQRGMLDDVSIVCWGEFGRTPKINPKGGRDHWPRVSCALLAGGGMRTGQVIGATNRLGEYAEDRPVAFSEVFATLYHNVGVDVRTTTVTDLQGRPQYLVDSGVAPMRELV